ncbi:hypothetical protein AOLI_G00269690 [Acnodon oligacanthus]
MSSYESIFLTVPLEGKYPRRKTGSGKLRGCVGYVYSQLQSLETMPGAEQATFSQTRTSTNRLSSSRELLWFLWTCSKETSSASLVPFMLEAKQELPRCSDSDLLTYFRNKMRASLFAPES